jgi:hypothetical protein
MKIDNETMYKGIKVKQYLKQQAQEFEKMIEEVLNQKDWNDFTCNCCKMWRYNLKELLKEVQGEEK